MNLYKSPQLYFLQKIISLILLVNCGILAQNDNIEKDLFSFFQIIEDKKEEEFIQQQAIKEIIAMGEKAISFVKARLKKTQNTHYFYILEKISPAKKTLWGKDKYFWKRYKKALELINYGKQKEAIKIMEAIIALEKNIYFVKNIKKSLKEAKKDPKDKIILTKAYATAKYFSFQDKWKIVIAIKNNTIQPIEISFSQKQLHLKITSTEFYLSGANRTNIKSKFPKIHNQIIIGGGKWWKAEIIIPPLIPKQQCYQELDIKVDIKLVTLRKAGKNYFPKIKFPPAKIKVLPKKYHAIMSNPTAYFNGAINNRYYEVLFYASFFIPQKNKVNAISELINNLEIISLSSLVKSILLRFTKQNFSSIQRWKIWWRAHKGL